MHAFGATKVLRRRRTPDACVVRRPIHRVRVGFATLSTHLRAGNRVDAPPRAYCQRPGGTNRPTTMAKRKLTTAQRAAKKKRRKDYQMVFVEGKMKRVRRPPTIDELSIDEFIRQNADPNFFHAEGMWWELEESDREDSGSSSSGNGGDNADDLPF